MEHWKGYLTNKWKLISGKKKKKFREICEVIVDQLKKEINRYIIPGIIKRKE